MSVFRVKGRIDGKGMLTAEMPLAMAGQTVDVAVDVPDKDPSAESEVLKLLADSFGMVPELARADQGELPDPKSW